MIRYLGHSITRVEFNFQQVQGIKIRTVHAIYNLLKYAKRNLTKLKIGQRKTGRSLSFLGRWVGGRDKLKFMLTLH